MHVDVSPRQFDVIAGIPQPIVVTLSNTGDVIGGYTLRVLGADPSWVGMDDAEITLFPDETRTVVVTLEVPPGMTAGDRRVALQVREVTPPFASIVEDVVLSVPEAPSVTVTADPVVVSAGRTAKLSILVANEGNTRVSGRMHGQDPEGRVRFEFSPGTVDLAPGENTMIDLRARSRRPLTGSPVIRPLELRMLDEAQSSALDRAQEEPVAAGVAADAGEPAPRPSAAQKLSPKLRRKRPPLVGDDVPAQAQATFVQRATISRGGLSLVGLLVAVTVFAIVITLSLGQLVGRSAEDRDLALAIAAAGDASATGGSAQVGGTVRLLTSSEPVEGVEVSVFAADDTESARGTIATDRNGAWKVADLPAGDYKFSFRGAGFVQLWYPTALDAADGQTVTVESGGQQLSLDVDLGGVPASISGTVVGADVSNATLTLKAPLDATNAGAGANAPIPADGVDNPSVDVASEGATVTSVPIGDDGTFSLTDVPSPQTYDLVVEKEGYATSTQRIDVSAGEEREDVEITLRQGDGVISGTVSSATQKVEGATITATVGQTSVTTTSQTGAQGGDFTLRGLPTPAAFTLVVSQEGYASQTLTVALGEGQRLTGVAVNLDKSSGELCGKVISVLDDLPAPDVTVTVTDGSQTVQTATQSDDSAGPACPTVPGTNWKASGLPLPGDYTITFARADLESQTVAVALDGEGNVSADAENSAVVNGVITVRLQASTAVVFGKVTQSPTRGVAAEPAGETVVQLISNTATYSVVAASVPAASAGDYRFDAVPPGTYTLQTSRSGVTPTTETLTVEAGQEYERNLKLDPPASLSGVITNARPGWVVELYRSSAYPSQTYLTTTVVMREIRGRGCPENMCAYYEFLDIDAPQTYVIQVRRTSGGAPLATARAEVNRSEPQTKDFQVRSDG
ncbi:hypothetical protein FE634_22105 [Nocardioides dongxiaopingii]|uniref:carboxypeptidase regulatory-like domain-containing protein n=1 Tax=Nocardioides TaxID=1839 RepID=UPI0010C76FD3|nr:MULTISPECIES: carboxypeptidase regulatory-like domain-containing protein [Nocardioides]QDH11160.1 hypothetical protein FE634_22105 [Nocardioides sp. S-1144]